MSQINGQITDSVTSPEPEKLKSEFLTPLNYRPIDDKEYVLLSDLVYRSALLGGTITMPKGFVFDGASVPRIPIVYMLFGDRAHYEAVPHDFGYRSPGHIVQVDRPNGVVDLVLLTKKMCDDIFLEAMKVRQEEYEKNGIVKHRKGWFIRSFMWSGVWIGGYSSYKNGPKNFKIIEV